MPLSLAAAMRDPKLLGGPFVAPSFWPWHAVAKLLSGERLDRREAALFRECTGRTKLPTKPVRRMLLLVGRRGGKDRFMSALAVYRAALAANWAAVLSAGEQAVVILIGADKKQAKILRRYCNGLLAAPLLAEEVSRQTDELAEFKNGAALEIVTNDADLVRGRSAIAVLGTEVCFWRTDEASSSSDEEVVAAAEPAGAMIPDGGLVVLSSSVRGKVGYAYRRFKELHGNDDAEDICWLAPSRTMNPSLPEKVVAKALAEDPLRAGAEYLSKWRDSDSNFIPADVITAATDHGIRERTPLPNVIYTAFCDAAGGTGKDSFTLGIAHREPNGAAMLDVLRERKPRFVPAAVVAEFSALLRAWGITSISGDRYSGGWHSDEWTRNGIRYEPSEQTKSEIYLAVLPLLLSGRARLLDIPALRQQFVCLERRVHPTGRESVDSGSASAHEDMANAASGALVRATSHTPMIFTKATVDAIRFAPKYNRLAYGERSYQQHHRLRG